MPPIDTDKFVRLPEVGALLCQAQIGQDQAGDRFISQVDSRRDFRGFRQSIESLGPPAGLAAEADRAGLGEVGIPQLCRHLFLGPVGAESLPDAHDRGPHEDGRHRRSHAERGPVAPGEFVKAVSGGWSGGADRFMREEVPEIGGEGARGFVAARAVFLQSLQHNGGEIARRRVKERRFPNRRPAIARSAKFLPRVRVAAAVFP